MRYWDDDHPEWDAEEHAFAAAWRRQPKWVVSRSLPSVGPNATLVGDDLEAAIRTLKAERRRRDRSRRPGPRAQPHRPRPDRRVPHLPAPRRARPRHALLRRTPPAAPPRGQRPDRRGRDPADLRPRLIARLPDGNRRFRRRGFRNARHPRSPPRPGVAPPARKGEAPVEPRPGRRPEPMAEGEGGPRLPDARNRDAPARLGAETRLPRAGRSAPLGLDRSGGLN